MAGLLDQATKTATSTTSGVGDPQSTVSGATKGGSGVADSNALPSGRLDVIKGVLGLNTNHKGELIGLSKDDNDALINVLAKEKVKKDRNMTDEEVDKLSAQQVLEMSKLDTASNEEIAELGKKDSVQKAKNNAQKNSQTSSTGTSPSSNSSVFYAYGVQKVGGLNKRYLYTFSNAAIANQYIQRLQDTYGTAVKRHGAQFFTLPDIPNPFTIAESQEFKQFDQKYIVEEAQAPQPIIPPMDEKGYSTSRVLSPACACQGSSSGTKPQNKSDEDSATKTPGAETSGQSSKRKHSTTFTNDPESKGTNNTGGRGSTTTEQERQSGKDACHNHCCGCHGVQCGNSDTELIRVATKVADEKKQKGDNRGYADIFAEAFRELKSTTRKN
ncbi:hypothetical protein BJX99DRAFT_250855 [Aspergillus californicus]